MQSSREVVRRTYTFTRPDRLAREFPHEYGGNDFCGTGVRPSPDARPRNGVDNWGCVWRCIGDMNLGEVIDWPLKSWDDFDRLTFPDFSNDDIWQNVRNARASSGDRFISGGLISIFERVHFVRGLENVWCDIIEYPDKLRVFVNKIVDLNIQLIDGYAKYDLDGIGLCDDWGLQERLMISPDQWRDIWKPAYTRMFSAAHAAGLATNMHSCGYIIDIIGDLIEAGLDMINLDQQENMGLANLERYRGKITFICPVDIQQTMARGNADEIRAYCRELVARLGTPDGGFVAKWYSDPVGAGHTAESIAVMCEEFLRISGSMYGH